MKIQPITAVKNEADKSAKIYLYGIIGDYWTESPLTAKAFLRELTALEGKLNRVDIHINSPGGDVWEGLGIANAIRASKMELHTYNDGLCASMASAILCSAKNGNRHAAKQSLTMIHNASTIVWGNSEDMRNEAETLEKHDDVLAGFYADASGKTVEEIKAEYFDFKDHWLTADEAEKAGLVKIEDYSAEDVPENVTNMPFQKVAALFNSKAIIQNQHTEMGILSNKFKKLSALAKVAAAAITAEQVEEINTEIAEQEIEGVTLVLDTELQETVEAAEKVPGLEASIAEKDQEIKNLKDENAKLQAKIDAKPAEEAGSPTSEGDEIPPVNKKDEVSFETSFDREVKAMKG